MTDVQDRGAAVETGLPDARFEALWAQHSATVLRYAARRVLPGDVDDVVAETFVIAWRRIGEVPDPALPWLLGVARGVAANTTRSARRRDALREHLTSEARTAAPVGADPVSAEMLAALQRLSAADRELLTLVAWDGLTAAEAAQVLGCRRGTVAVRLHRARARLRAQLAACQGEGRRGSAGPSNPGDPRRRLLEEDSDD